jgi:hypothetical protein
LLVADRHEIFTLLAEFCFPWGLGVLGGPGEEETRYGYPENEVIVTYVSVTPFLGKDTSTLKRLADMGRWAPVTTLLPWPIGRRN